MSRYTSATDADRQEMLAAIGVDTIDDLFADVPEGVRLGRALDLPAGKPEQEVYARLRDLAAQEHVRRGRAVVPRRRHVRPLRPRADRLDPAALGVPDAVHALPARDQPGRAAGDVRVPDGDLRADRPAGLQRLGLRGPERGRRRRLARAHPHAQDALPRLRRPAPALARDARDDVGRAGGRRSRRSRSTNGLTDLTRRRRRRRRRLPRPAELLRRDRGPRDAVADRPRDRRAARRPGRPADARRAAPARATSTSTSASAKARRSATGWTSAGRRSASSPRRRPTCGGCRAGSPARRPTSTAAAASC